MRLLSAIPLAGLALLASGCIYSQQNYGSPRTQAISVGANKADVFANMGMPDSVYKADNGEVFAYKFTRGKTILGLHTKVRRTDLIVVMDNAGVVQFAGPIEMGTGISWFAPLATDTTYPIGITHLMADPANYDYRFEATD